MQPYHANITDKTNQNTYFRQVLFTSNHAQLVVMSLKPGEEIGMEVHEVDQYLFFLQGTGRAILNGQESNFSPGDVYVVPNGTEHNFINSGDGEVKLYTIYAPAEHPDGTVHKTKAEAEAAEAEHHDKPMAV